MELEKKNIHMDDIKTAVNSQLVLEEDINLPDTKPDMNRICLEKSNVLIDEVKPYADTVHIRGRLLFQILYHTEEEGCSLATMEGRISFEEKMHVQGADSFSTVNAQAAAEDFSVSIINSRKLSIRSLINLSVRVEEIHDEEVPVGISGQERIEYRKSPIEIAQIVIHKNDVFRIREEVGLPNNYPNIFQILWSRLDPEDIEIHPLDEKLSVSGDLRVLFIYESEEGTVHSLETSIPFSGNMECHGSKDGMIPDIEYQTGQQEFAVRPDNDGEERVVSLEVLLELKIKLYEEAKTELITDVYGVANEVNTLEKEIQLRKLLAKNTIKHKLEERVHIGARNSNLLQLMHSEGNVLLDHVQGKENGLSVNGMLQLQILSVSGDDGKPYDVVKTQIPYQYDIEIPGMQPKDIYDVQAGAEQLQITILDGEELDVKAVLVFWVTVFRQDQCKVVSEIKTAPLDTKKLGELPGMAVYVVKPGDNLWNIGRKYYISVDRLKKLNELSGDEIRPGQKLLIVKEGL